MIKRVFLWLVFLALVVLLGQQLLKGTGYLLIVLPDGQTSIEMSFWTGLALIAISWFVAAWVLNLVGWLANPLRGLRNYRARFKSQRALKTTVKGLVELSQGRWSKARKLLIRVAKNSGMPLINYLAAAQAAHYEGRDKDVELFLQAAEKTTPNAGVAVDFIQVRIQLDKGHYEQALATLVRLHQKIPSHPVVLHQLRDVHLALLDWKPLIQLMPELRRYQIGTPEALNQLERKIYLHRFDELLQDVHRSDNLEAIKELWEGLPSRMKLEEALILAWLRVLVKQGELASAEQLLKRSLKASWSVKLIEQYGLLPKEAEPKRRLLEAEQWLKERPNDPALLHALARISQQQGLWRKALEYYQASYQLQAKDQLCAEMAKLYIALGDERQGQFFQRLALQGLQRQLPELPLPQSR